MLKQTLKTTAAKIPTAGVGAYVNLSPGSVTRLLGQDMENSIFKAELATLVLVIFCFFIGMMSHAILITLSEAYTIEII